MELLDPGPPHRPLPARPTLALGLLLAALAGAPHSLAAQTGAAAAPADDPVARAVLFYSVTCPHCRDVIQIHLPPLVERYGDRLQIVGLDVAEPVGQRLYQAMAHHFLLAPDRTGVPTLVMGPHVLVGAGEIPDRLPGLVDRALEGGGVDWPGIPGLKAHLRAQGVPVEGDTADGGAMSNGAADGGLTLGLPDHSESVLDRFLRDPVGNSLSATVLLLMVVTLGAVTTVVARGRDAGPPLPSWLVPTLALVGMAIAGYLAWVEMTGSLAVCGPVGDCNTVQQSRFATILGIPVGLLGMVGYAAMIGAWAATRARRPELRARGWLGLWGMAAAGTAFSAWLTFLEPFVIGATCIWCVTSAVIMTALLVLATPWAARVRRSAPLP